MGVAQDFEKGMAAWNKKKWAAALREFVPLAQQGDAVAQGILSEAYRDGKGVKQDYALARKWMLRSANQEDDMAYIAQFQMGEFYALGLGVPQDFTTAVKWYRKSAEHGNRDAHSVLGHAYYKGLGVPQDNVSAHMWFNIAASLGHPQAEKDRDIVARKMTSVELAKAQKRASACVRKNYKGC